MRNPLILSWVLAAGLAVVCLEGCSGTAEPESTELASQRQAADEQPPEMPVVPRAPDTVAEGEIYIPPLPTMEQVAPPPGWVTSGPEVPPRVGDRGSRGAARFPPVRSRRHG